MSADSASAAFGWQRAQADTQSRNVIRNFGFDLGYTAFGKFGEERLGAFNVLCADRSKSFA
jgi:hypothetical protein